MERYVSFMSAFSSFLYFSIALMKRLALNKIGFLPSNRSTRGMSGIVNSALTMFTDIASGITVTTEKALRDQGELIKNQIDTINKRAAASITELRAKFSQMEQQISKVQQQGARLSQLTNTSTSK